MKGERTGRGRMKEKKMDEWEEKGGGKRGGIKSREKSKGKRQEREKGKRYEKKMNEMER